MAENQATFTVRGVGSDDEAGRIEDAVRGVDGVMGADIDPGSGEAAIRFDVDLISEERVRQAVRDAGYEVE